MVQPQIPPQPPMVSGTRTQADLDRNEETAAHRRQDELAARARKPADPSPLERLLALLGAFFGR